MYVAWGKNDSNLTAAEAAVASWCGTSQHPGCGHMT